MTEREKIQKLIALNIAKAMAVEKERNSNDDCGQYILGI